MKVLLIILAAIIGICLGPIGIVVFLLLCAIDLQTNTISYSPPETKIEKPAVNNNICQKCSKELFGAMEILDGGIKGRTCIKCNYFNKEISNDKSNA